MQTLQNSNPGNVVPTLSDPQAVSLHSLQQKLDLLESRLPSDPFHIGGRSFNSKADVADRVGLNEEEATHVALFKLTIPSEFGASKDLGIQNSKFPLPAIKTFDSWDPQDNVTGKAKRIRDGINDLELSIQSTIGTVCRQSEAARVLAFDMLQSSKVFIENLSTWMTSFYLELLKTSQVPPDEAWHLVAACVHQFFVVIREFRAPASKANVISDPALKTTTYLWAMIQVHRVMKDIRDSQFRGHPSVAPIINLHVFKTRVTTTAFHKLSDSLKAFTKQLGDNQKLMDKLDDRIMKLEKK